MRAVEFLSERNNGTRWTGDELFRQIGDEGLNESQQTTLNKLYSGDFPERDDAFWDYVNQSEFDLPLTIQSITPQKLQIILLSQYRIEHLDELFDMMDEDQQETVERYTNDPNLSNSTIVMYDGRIIDGNHRALAAALKKVPVKYVDLGDLENNPDLDEDMSRRGFLGALGGLAMGAAGMDASAKTAPIKPKTKSPSQQVIQQAQKQQTAKQATPSKDPQAEAMLYRTAKASGMKGDELAQFLAQTKHESWDHSRLQEKPVGDPNAYFTKKYDPTRAPKTAKILGNKHRGDGAKYHGRGFIQLTGRDNYRMASDALGIDLLNHPDLASKPDVAAKIAVWYWNTRVKPKVHNFGDTVAVTKTINNAMFGLEDRLANFIDYKKRVS